MAALKELFTNRASLKAAVDRHTGEPSRVPIYLTNHRHGTLDTFSLIPPINIRRKATARSKKLRRSRPKIPASPPAAPGSRQVARGWPRCLQSAPAAASATRRTETKAIGDQGRNAVTRPRWGQR